MNPSPPVGDVYPSLFYENAGEMIEWLCRAFGFAQRFVMRGPDDRIEHSELTCGAAVIMVASPNLELGFDCPRNPLYVNQVLSIRIDDPDAHYAQAKAEGAIILRELKDEDYGSRGYMAKDPEGFVWCFATYRPGQYWEI
ncbi:MAG TPA: VOC family protein [Schlesneria sp.]|jgi:uncharacterized glyoxalase superfamily protein PhnB